MLESPFKGDILWRNGVHHSSKIGMAREGEIKSFFIFIRWTCSFLFFEQYCVQIVYIIGHDFYACICFSNNMLHLCFRHEMSLRIGSLVSKERSCVMNCSFNCRQSKKVAIVTDCIFLSHKTFTYRESKWRNKTKKAKSN